MCLWIGGVNVSILALLRVEVKSRDEKFDGVSTKRCDGFTCMNE